MAGGQLDVFMNCAVWSDLSSLVNISWAEQSRWARPWHYHTVLGDRPVNPSYIDCVWPFSNPSLLWRVNTYLFAGFDIYNPGLAVVAHVSLSINRILPLRNCLNRPEGCAALSFPGRRDRAVSFGVLSLRPLDFEHCRPQ